MSRFMIACLLLAPAVPVSAQIKSPIELTTDAADRAVLPEAMAAIATQPFDLARLESVLVKLSRPTPLRGMVQSARSWALARAERTGEAVAAIDEALRLLPDHPVPKVFAAQILTFSGAPQRAADLWLEAARLSPEVARTADQYVLGALGGRLRDLGDRVRADRILARMGEIGFANGSPPQRSASALARMRAFLAQGDPAGAQGTIAAMSNPLDLLTVLTDRRYEPLWADAGRWGGTRLEDQSRRYLEELRREWAESGTFKSAVDYARALAGANAHGAVASLFAPMYDAPGLSAATPDVEFLAPVVARSLAATGREEEGARLLARVAAMFPRDNSGRDLNMLAALMTTDMNALRWAAVPARATEFLDRARTAGPSVNQSAIMQVRAARGCAHWQLGRRNEADVDMGEVLLMQAMQPGTAWRVLLCRGDETTQRAFLLARLSDENTRGWALRLAQPAGTPGPTALERAEQVAGDRMRRDPAFMAAVANVGRILPHPVGDTLPSGFDPFAARPQVRRRPGDV